jgi:hypothetical protein
MSILRLQEIRAKTSEFTKFTVESLGGFTSKDPQLSELILESCRRLDQLTLEDASNLLVLPTLEHWAGSIIQENLQKLVTVQPPADWNVLHAIMDKCKAYTSWLSREYQNVSDLDSVTMPTTFAQMQRDLFCVPPWISAMLLGSRRKVCLFPRTRIYSFSSC